MRFPSLYPSSEASYFLGKMLQVMGLATIVAVPVCFAGSAHANDFYRSNRQSNHRNGFPVRGRVIINLPQQRTTQLKTIIQIGGFGSRNDRFSGQQYNNGHIQYDRFGRDRYNNDRYNNSWHNNNRNIRVIRSYNDRYSDHGLFLQTQPKDRPFFSGGHQVGTTEIRRFPIINRQRPYLSFPFQQINRW